MTQISLSDDDRKRIDSLTRELKLLNKGGRIEILLSCREAARLIGRTPCTITTMLKDGRLTRKTIGESTGIPLSDVLEISAGMR